MEATFPEDYYKSDQSAGQYKGRRKGRGYLQFIFHYYGKIITNELVIYLYFLTSWNSWSWIPPIQADCRIPSHTLFSFGNFFKVWSATWDPFGWIVRNLFCPGIVHNDIPDILWHHVVCRPEFEKNVVVILKLIGQFAKIELKSSLTPQFHM